jgi:hypothetical protein
MVELHDIQPIPLEGFAPRGSGVSQAQAQYGSVPDSAFAAASALPGGACEAFSYYKSIGLSANASAGIVGNLIQESHMDPFDGKGKAHIGIAQWDSVIRWPRLVAYAHAQKPKQYEYGLYFQITYVHTEMQLHYNFVLTFLKKKNIAVDSATNEVYVYFEGAGGDGTLGKRISYANQVLKGCK